MEDGLKKPFNERLFYTLLNGNLLYTGDNYVSFDDDEKIEIDPSPWNKGDIYGEITEILLASAEIGVKHIDGEFSIDMTDIENRIQQHIEGKEAFQPTWNFNFNPELQKDSEGNKYTYSTDFELLELLIKYYKGQDRIWGLMSLVLHNRQMEGNLYQTKKMMQHFFII